MSKENVKENGNSNGHTMGEAPKGWKKIETDRLVYAGDRGKGGLIQGDLLGLLDMPPSNGKPWQAFVVRLTAPCATCQDRDKQKVTAPAGSEILVPINHQLRQHLARASTHPTAIAEVFLRPKGNRKTPAGEMVVWDIHVNPQLKRREPADRLLAMSAGAPQLAEAGASGQGAIAEDEIPF